MEEFENINPEVVEIKEEDIKVENIEPKKSKDSGNFGWAVLGFAVPLVGLILYIVWKEERPKDAKNLGIGAIVGFFVNLFFSTIFSLFLEPLILAWIEQLEGALALII